jgi:hypothetical protein
MTQSSPTQEQTDQTPAASFPIAGLPPLPPTFPPGVNPQMYKLDLVSYLLEQAAFLNMFAVDNPDEPDVPIPAPDNPNAMIGLHVNDVPHRFEVTMKQPTLEKGLRANNIVGEQAANLSLRWMVIPDDFEAAPGREPPPTPLDFTRSQRFTMLDGTFDFGGGNYYHGFGAGRTFPAIEGGKPVLRLGAIATVLEGFGVFKGKIGCYVIQGYITPPRGLFLNYLCRIIDLDGALTTVSTLPDIAPIPNPDPGATFMTLLGGRDPDHPPQIVFGPDGQMQGARIHELLRLVHLNFAVRHGNRIRSQTTVGPIIGNLATNLSFNPFGAAPGTTEWPIPWGTAGTVITFWDHKQKPIGTLEANVVEGRAFKTDLPGAPMQVFRLAGFGPFVGGTGYFAGADGMLSVNAAISVLPGALSNLYVLRFVDPDGQFRAATFGI